MYQYLCMATAVGGKGESRVVGSLTYLPVGAYNNDMIRIYLLTELSVGVRKVSFLVEGMLTCRVSMEVYVRPIESHKTLCPSPSEKH